MADEMSKFHAANGAAKNAEHAAGFFDTAVNNAAAVTRRVLQANPPVGRSALQAGDDAWAKFHGPAGGPFNGKT